MKTTVPISPAVAPGVVDELEPIDRPDLQTAFELIDGLYPSEIRRLAFWYRSMADVLEEMAPMLRKVQLPKDMIPRAGFRLN